MRTGIRYTQNLVRDFSQSIQKTLVLLDLPTHFGNQVIDLFDNTDEHRLRNFGEMRNQFGKRGGT